MHAAISIDAGWLVTVVLLSLRLGAAFIATPLLGSQSVPLTIRALIVLGLAAVLSLGLPGAEVAARAPGGAMGGGGALLQAGFCELALGATLGLGILVAFASISMAGQLLGVQMGFGLGQVIDPATRRQVPIVAAAFDQLAVLAFFLVNGHHALLRGLAYSLERFPLGQPWPLERAVEPVLQQVGGLFTLGFALAAPVVFCVLMVEVALGVVARNMPQINMLTMGIPVKIIVGIIALSVWLGGVGPTLDRVYASIYRTWDAIFPVAAAVDLTAPPARLAALLAGRPGGA
ncbi:MAG: flagellar biosynthetic protein FliR [Anaeromyxobacter sp.]